MDTLTWLHISDLHFHASQAYDTSTLQRALLRDITERFEQDGLRPDLILISGDVGFSGKSNEYSLAQVFFDDLLRVTNLPKDRLFLTPGNHDVDQRLISQAAKITGRSLARREDINAVLADVKDRQLMFDRFCGYAAFVNDYFTHLDFSHDRYFCVRPVNLAGQEVKILCLNSAWVYIPGDMSNTGMLIGERQVCSALDIAKPGHDDLVIALLHHPLDKLRETDRDDSAAILLRNCDFILHGHLHHEATKFSHASGPDDEAIVIAAGACYVNQEYPTSYNYVRLNLRAGVGDIYLRRYSDHRGGFWTLDNQTYRNASDGMYTFELHRQSLVHRLPTEHFRMPANRPFQAPNLPSHLVDRLEVVNQIKHRLLEVRTHRSGFLDVSVIHGLGGVGKTVLAARLAHDEAVIARFSDGILWADLDQESDALPCLSEWIQSLGDYRFRASTVDGASRQLRSLLRHKACLLVIDGAWDPHSVRPFLVGGPRCRVIVTTRDAALARQIDAYTYYVDVMTETQAQDLFKAILGSLNSHQEQATTLVAQLGYLPLAIELAAAQILEDSCSWTRLEEYFHQSEVDLATLDTNGATQRHESLRISFRSSIDRLRSDEKEAFSQLGLLPGRARLNARMASTLWGQPESESARLLRRLRDKAFLRSAEENSYVLHDLLHHEAKRLLLACTSLPSAHAALLSRYRASTRRGRWHTLPDDGYIHAHLAWHMEQAHLQEELHSLLHEETSEGKNAWYEVRSRLGQIQGYMNDVIRAWQLTEMDSSDTLIKEPIGYQCSYALITASLNSLASKHLPLPLLSALIKNDIWTAIEGLGYARRVPDPLQRAFALVEVSSYVSSREQILDEAIEAAQDTADIDGQSAVLIMAILRLAKYGNLPKALALARAIGPKERRASALCQLSDYLPMDLKKDALSSALIATRGIKKTEEKDRALAILAPRLAEADYLEEAISAIWEIKAADERTQVLDEVASRLPSNLLEQVLVEAHDLSDTSSRARTLIALLPHLPERQKKETSRETLALVRGLTNVAERANMLLALLSHLPVALREQVLAEALDIVSRIPSESSRARALVKAAKYSYSNESDILESALEVVHGIRNERQRTDAQADLALCLVRFGYFDEAIDMVQTIKGEGMSSKVSVELVSLLPAELRAGVAEEALTAAQEVWPSSERVDVLTKLAPYLSSERKRDALQEALAETWRLEETRASALSQLAGHLSRDLLGEALVTAVALGDAEDCRDALATLAPQLAKLGNLEDGLAAVRVVRDPRSRMSALADLSRQCAESGDLQRSLMVAKEITDNEVRAHTLIDLIPFASADRADVLLREALTAAQIEDDQEALLEQLALKLMRQGLYEYGMRVLENMRDINARIGTLARSVPYLEEFRDHALQETLMGIEGIEEIDLRLSTIMEISPYLSTEQVNELLEDALLRIGRIRNPTDRASKLTKFGLYLTGSPREEVLEKALVAASDIGDADERARVLIALLPGLPMELRSEIVQHAFAAVREIDGEIKRASTLAALAAHLPLKQRKETVSQSLSIAKAITNERWRVAALMELSSILAKSGLLRESLATIREIKGDGTRAQAIANVAGYLSTDLLEEAFAMAAQIDSERWRAEALAGLAPHIPEELLGRALNTSKAIANRQLRSDVLQRLAARLTNLPSTELYLIWQETLFDLAARTRQDLLADLGSLTPVIVALGGAEAGLATFRAIQDVSRWWH